MWLKLFFKILFGSDEYYYDDVNWFSARVYRILYDVISIIIHILVLGVIFSFLALLIGLSNLDNLIKSINEFMLNHLDKYSSNITKESYTIISIFFGIYGIRITFLALSNLRYIVSKLTRINVSNNSDYNVKFFQTMLIRAIYIIFKLTSEIVLLFLLSLLISKLDLGVYLKSGIEFINTFSSKLSFLHLFNNLDGTFVKMLQTAFLLSVIHNIIIGHLLTKPLWYAYTVAPNRREGAYRMRVMNNMVYVGTASDGLGKRFRQYYADTTRHSEKIYIRRHFIRVQYSKEWIIPCDVKENIWFIRYGAPLLNTKNPWL